MQTKEFKLAAIYEKGLQAPGGDRKKKFGDCEIED